MQTDKLDDDKLLELNRIGIIPGPDEDEAEFRKRADYCLTLHNVLPKDLLGESFAVSDVSKSALNESQVKLDIAPVWVPVFFSNYQLLPWHGGCAWIFQQDESSPTAAFFQLRQAFRNSTRYLRIYNRDELLVHEMAHVGRMKFDEPKFEELLAYRTSQSTFRRYFGPLVESSYESMSFVLLLFLILTSDFFFIAFGQPEALGLAMWAKIIPLALICLALLRLWYKQRVFEECLKAVAGCVKDLHKAEALCYRLLDKEIQSFAKMNSQEIASYAEKERKGSLRWKLLFLAYFPRD